MAEPPKPRRFGQSVGTPRVSAPGSTRRTVSFKKAYRPVVPKRIAASTAMPADNTRVAYERANPFKLQQAMLGPILESRAISIVVVNQTKDRIGAAEIEQAVAATPMMNLRLGSITLRYKYRVVSNWKVIDPDPDTWKNPATEWSENTNIGTAEIVIAVSEEDRPTIRQTGTPRPRAGVRVDLYIPPILLTMLARGVFQFVDHLTVDNTAQYRPNLNLPIKDPIQARLDRADSLYNKNRDKAGYAVNAWKNAGLTVEKAAWNTAKTLRPVMQVDPGKLIKHYDWIGKQVSQFADDYQIIPANTSTTGGRVLSGVGKGGTMLSVGILSYKAYKNTWTAATVADGTIMVAGIVAAVLAGTQMAVAILVLSAAYAMVDLFTGGEISDFWEAMFPRNKPFAPPNFTYFVTR
jgi:hypothetical protein